MRVGKEGEGSIGLFVYFYFAVDFISSRFKLTSFVCIMCLQYYSPLEPPPPAPILQKPIGNSAFAMKFNYDLGLHIRL
jgi:hypothetical protein